MTESFASGLIGVVLDGRYRLDAVLGEGGMGAVFRAQQLAMDRRVAVKLLKPHLVHDDAALRRFQREARGTFKVDSPHAVKVLDYGITELRDYYIVLEYLDGRTVQRELEVDGTFTPLRVAHIARQALDALAAAHRVGLVHRDLKPDNILLMRAGADADYTKVLDFGVAKLMDNAQSPALSQMALTQRGMIFGTPEFMSPEQCCGHALDGRSDLYALAATMFAMLTGRGLYDCTRAIDWLTHHATEPAPHLGDVVPELARYRELDALLQRCLSKHREQRPATAEAMAAELTRIEPTLDPAYVEAAAVSAPAAATTTPAERRKMFATSSQYIAALPPSISGAVDTGVASMTTGAETGAEVALLHGRSRVRVRWLVAGAVMAVAIVSVAIALAVTHSTHTSASASVSRDAAIAVRAVDAGVAVAIAPIDAAAASVVTAPPIDAAIASASPPPPPHRPSTPPLVPVPPPHNEAAELHVHNAEDAQRSGNHLRQLAEADLALRADPGNSRARFLLGDALLATGDLDRGCKYLRALGKSSAAVERSRAAGCP